jgi:hypothetical protein
MRGMGRWVVGLKNETQRSRVLGFSVDLYPTLALPLERGGDKNVPLFKGKFIY